MSSERLIVRKPYAGRGRRGGGEASPMPGLLDTRKSLGMSVGKLAQMSGVSTRMIFYIEQGYAQASEVVQERILEAVVHERRRQREEEAERWERIQRAGVGAATANTGRTGVEKRSIGRVFA